MKNLYLVETNTPGFNLAVVEDVSAGEIFEDIENVEEFLGIDCNNTGTPRIIETIENWEG